jgi:catechol 2,3-dioxygenase-like lactoylglutathione lyase family enzyme
MGVATKISPREICDAPEHVVALVTVAGRARESDLPYEHTWGYVCKTDAGRLTFFRAHFDPKEARSKAAGLADQSGSLCPGVNPGRKRRRETRMLRDGRVSTRIPVQDLQRARSFYAEKLGLEPSEARPGGLLYRCAEGEFALFESAGASSGTFTQMAWEVEDIEAVVDELRGRGVVFEEYDLPGLTTINGIAEVEGNYPSKGGIGERAAWFRDSEGNMLGIGQPVPSPRSS